VFSRRAGIEQNQFCTSHEIKKDKKFEQKKTFDYLCAPKKGVQLAHREWNHILN